MASRVTWVAVLLLPSAIAGAAGPDRYATGLTLSDGTPGARSTVTLSFRASGSDVERIGQIDLALAAGMRADPAAFGRACVLQRPGVGAGTACAEDFADARIGEGEMTVEMLGMHTVRADAYLVDGAPDGANLVFFFPSGQVFGVGAQSVLGTLDLSGAEPVRIRIHDIQKQLDLPFGATAELESGRFAFTGQGKEAGFVNPPDGTIERWTFTTELDWRGGGQKQTVRASVAEKP